jgi:hypothetical protein
MRIPPSARPRGIARLRPLCVLPALLVAGAALAQQQVVRPPIATYWVSGQTLSGMAGMTAGGGGLSAIMGMVTGGGSGPVRRLDLRLGSSQAPTGEPTAEHEIPPALNMGAMLPLTTPVREPVRREEPAERDVPEGVEPKGRMLIFWGCGEKAGPNQPIVIDFSKVAAGQRPQGLSTARVALPSGPAFGRSRGFGEWPNPKDSRAVPGGASLRGDHLVRSSYAPEIRFAVGERHDFMEPVALASSPMPSGAHALRWNRIPNATGYFMMAIGARQGGNDMVIWTSSARADSGGVLMDYLPPAEVARLVREQVVLPPDRTECALPAEAAKALETPMLNFVAYGEELNVVHPPRPQDPKVPWEQVYAVKVRQKSSSMVMIGAEGAMGMPGRRGQAPAAPPPGAPADQRSDAPPQDAPASGNAESGNANPVGEGLKEGARILRGIFGR